MSKYICVFFFLFFFEIETRIEDSRKSFLLSGRSKEDFIYFSFDKKGKKKKKKVGVVRYVFFSFFDDRLESNIIFLRRNLVKRWIKRISNIGS